MMTQANAATPDPVAAALAIAENARRKADRTEAHGMTAVAALAAGVILSLAAILAMAMSPATIPTWCATHGCPTAPTFPHAT